MTRTLDKGLVQIALDQIGNTFFTVTFLKKDGTERCARARLNVQSRMAHNDLSDAARARFAANGQIPFVDLDIDPATDRAKGWRSFKLDSVTSLHGAGMILNAR